MTRLDSVLRLPARALRDRAWTWGQIPNDVVGNCVCVALIKGTMHEGGNQVVLASRLYDGYEVTMRDGYRETVTDGQIAMAARRARFIGPDSDARAYAAFLYAAMAQRAAQTQTRGVTTFTAALDDMGSGYDSEVAARLLGVEKGTRSVSPARLGAGSTFVAWSEGHAVFVDGRHVDVNGCPEPYTKTDGRSAPLQGAFALTLPPFPAHTVELGPV